MTKDQVCNMDVDEKKAAATSEYKGKTYFVVLMVTKSHLTRIRRSV